MSKFLCRWSQVFRKKIQIKKMIFVSNVLKFNAMGKNLKFYFKVPEIGGKTSMR